MNRTAFILFALTASLLFGPASAQGGISAQSIVVNPNPSFGAEVFVDKDVSGRSTPTYQIGETIRIGVRVSRDSYVYLYNVRSNGQVVQILPNALDSGRDNYLLAGETRYFPRRDAGYTFQVDGPSGIDQVVAVASTRPLNTRELGQFRREGDFYTAGQSGQQSFARTLSIVVNPLPRDSWVTDTAQFRVQAQNRPQPRPVRAFLEVGSSPSGAAVYLDGHYIGQTPLRYGTTPGNYHVRIELGGYNVFTTRVDLYQGDVIDLFASLRRSSY
ncbi:MAG: DUF4384 domain-containing protein [Trueperaceae bacterium]|nr:DUF4384 domain-containing protein [Trueperaceae bacterium]